MLARRRLFIEKSLHYGACINLKTRTLVISDICNVRMENVAELKSLIIISSSTPLYDEPAITPIAGKFYKSLGHLG